MYIQPLYTYESIYHRCLMCHPYNEPQSRFRWSKCYQSRFPSQYAVKSSLLYFKFKSPILDSGQWHINKLLSSPYIRSHSITSGYLFRRILSPKSSIPDESSRPGNHDFFLKTKAYLRQWAKTRFYFTGQVVWNCRNWAEITSLPF